SRRGRGRLSLQLDMVDLRVVIDAAVDALTVTAGSRGIKVVTEVLSVCPRVRGDAARLEQVVSNLLGNAMKHSDCGTTIHVTLDAVGATARIVVRDEGHGTAHDAIACLRSGASAAPGARGRSARRCCRPRGSSRADGSRC